MFRLEMSLEKRRLAAGGVLEKSYSKNFRNVVNIAKFLRTAILKNICERLLLFNLFKTIAPLL